MPNLGHTFDSGEGALRGVRDRGPVTNKASGSIQGLSATSGGLMKVN